MISAYMGMTTKAIYDERYARPFNIGDESSLQPPTSTVLENRTPVVGFRCFKGGRPEKVYRHNAPVTPAMNW
jgi:hypothetical protein